MDKKPSPFWEKVGEIMNVYMDSKGPNWINGQLDLARTMEGMDAEGRVVQFSAPALKFKTRSYTGGPISFWFTKDDEEESDGKPVRLHCEFETEETRPDTKPLLLTEVGINLLIEDTQPIKHKLTVNYCTTRPQIVTGYCSLTMKDFLFLQSKLTQENAVHLDWDSVIRWFDVSKPEILEALKSKDSKQQKPSPMSTRFTGSVPVVVPETSESAYSGVDSLLKWEHYQVSEQYHIWFKNTMSDDTYEFLPQEFRIKADPLTNAPMMSIDMKMGTPGDVSTYRVIVGFEIAPYYHPRAKRDLYRLIEKRTKNRVTYCKLNYGGYDPENVKFEWAGDDTFAILKEYDIKKLAVNSEIKTSPDSSFRIALETSVFGLTRLKDFLSGERETEKGKDALSIGDVILTVKNGMKAEPLAIRRSVILDLRQLSGVTLPIEQLPGLDKKITIPYRVQITNKGIYDLKIDGFEMSLLSEKEQKKVLSVRNAIHSLTPVFSALGGVLKKGETAVVELDNAQALELSKKDKLFGIPVRDYWTTLLCEPHSVSLQGVDIKDILESFKSVRDVQLWTLYVRACFPWAGFPDLSKIMLEFKNEALGLRSSTELARGVSSVDHVLTDNLLSILGTQTSKGRTFQYRLQVTTSSGDSGWSNWVDATEDQIDFFDITEQMIKPLIL